MAGSKKRKKSKEAPQGHILAEGHSDVQGQAMEDGRALIFVRIRIFGPLYEYYES